MILLDALAWILDPAHWTGADSIPLRTGETLLASGLSLLIVMLVAIPLGVLIGHTGRGRGVAIVVGNIARALPTLGLISLLILLLGINLLPVVAVLVVLGIPPMLAGAYAGLEAVDRVTIDAARAMGMTEWQIVTKVELPLAAPLIVGGIRSAALQIIATAIVASYFLSYDLGYFIVQGLASSDYPKMLAGAILVVVLALVVDGLFAVVQRSVSPRGVPRRGTGPKAPRRGRSTNRPVEASIKEGMQS